jgi:hypothetical protein
LDLNPVNDHPKSGRKVRQQEPEQIGRMVVHLPHTEKVFRQLDGCFFQRRPRPNQGFEPRSRSRIDTECGASQGPRMSMPCTLVSAKVYRNLATPEKDRANREPRVRANGANTMEWMKSTVRSAFQGGLADRTNEKRKKVGAKNVLKDFVGGLPQKESKDARRSGMGIEILAGMSGNNQLTNSVKNWRRSCTVGGSLVVAQNTPE